jgi:excisionase family DNA binding protein
VSEQKALERARYLMEEWRAQGAHGDLQPAILAELERLGGVLQYSEDDEAVLRAARRLCTAWRRRKMNVAGMSGHTATALAYLDYELQNLDQAEDEGWLTVPEAALALGYGKQHVRRLIAQGKLVAHRRMVEHRIDPESVDRFKAERPTAGNVQGFRDEAGRFIRPAEPVAP